MQIVLAPVKDLVHHPAIALTATTKPEGTFDTISFNQNLLQAMFDECYFDSFRTTGRAEPSSQRYLLESQQQRYLGYSVIAAGLETVNQLAVIVNKHNAVANLQLVAQSQPFSVAVVFGGSTHKYCLLVSDTRFVLDGCITQNIGEALANH